MDTALPPEDLQVVRRILEAQRHHGVEFHALRTRQSGSRRFVSFHVLVPGEWTVHQGHQFLDRIEREMREALPGTTVFTHLESLDDPASFGDAELDLVPPGKPPGPVA
jgi:divalent metal cation (Fe/Co/Zn/Cd) transporter